MGACNKCGRTISYRLGSLCMRCRYINKRQGAPSIVAKIQPRPPKVVICAECGKEILVEKTTNRTLCDHCRKYRVKRCIQCGAEFETSLSNAKYRDHCYKCKPRRNMGRVAETPPSRHRKLSEKQKAEKMRAIKASGLYMQLMQMRQTITEPETAPDPSHSWLPETGWIPVGEEPKGPAPKATLKRRIK